MLDAADLTELVCIPRAGGINVQPLRFLRHDGTEVAFAERHSRGSATG